MKANELRIGNLVNYNEGGIFKVIGIHEFGIDCEDEIETTYMEYENFKPIPLTEEWLLKFGFEERMFGWWSDVLFLRTENRNGYFYDWQKTNQTTGTYIEYVHQLQNLYFALTGEELTFKSE
jgi:hypothetical protein